MNQLILGFLGLLSVTLVTGGILEFPTGIEHDGYQTPFVPILPPQSFDVSSLENDEIPQEALPVSAYPQHVPSIHSEIAPPFTSTHLATAQLQVVDASHAAIPNAIPHIPVQHILPKQTVQVHKTIFKQIQVPYPVNKYIKVDRHIPVIVDRHYKVNRPYEVIKYVQKPYIVKVERKVHVPVISKVAVPHPIVQIEPVIAQPQHIQAHKHHEYGHY